MITPQITTITKESIREAQNSYGKKSRYFTLWYKTYRELKKDIKRVLEECYENEVSVCRSRRGEWGEWFEIWGLNSQRKPFIKKQGWQ
jgi:hypothetical protein